MKVVFLDFDGVLNDGPFLRGIKSHGESRVHNAKEGWDWIAMVDPEKVERLNQIIDKTDCKFVVSSSWRIANTVEELQGYLDHHGFKGELIGYTPAKLTNHLRGNEINWWLSGAKGKGHDVEAFVILDDNSDMGHLLNYLVQTDFDPKARGLVGVPGGLQQRHVDEIVERLNNPTKPPQRSKTVATFSTMLGEYVRGDDDDGTD